MVSSHVLVDVLASFFGYDLFELLATSNALLEHHSVTFELLVDKEVKLSGSALVEDALRVIHGLNFRVCPICFELSL